MTEDINDLISTLIIHAFLIYYSHFSGSPGASLPAVRVWVTASELPAPSGLQLPGPED